MLLQMTTGFLQLESTIVKVKTKHGENAFST
jgi:hypothetical protein